MSQDNTAVNDEVVEQNTTATDSAPVESNSSVDANDELEIPDVPLVPSRPSQDTESEAEPTAEENTTEEPTTEETTGDQTQTETQTASPEDEWSNLKGSSQDRFRQAINERNELRQRLEELEARKAQFATEQDLLNEINPETGDYYTPQEAERASWQQSREAQAERINREMYETQIRQNQLAIDDEATRVQQEFSLLNPKSNDYDQEVASQYAAILNDSLIYAMPDGQTYSRATLVANGVDPDTQATLVNTTVSPYKIAKLVAGSYAGAKAQGETLGQAKAQQAAEKMMANADAPANASQSSTTSNDLDAVFDRVKNIPLG